jgi:hypothetical protein
MFPWWRAPRPRSQILALDPVLRCASVTKSDPRCRTPTPRRRRPGPDRRGCRRPGPGATPAHLCRESDWHGVGMVIEVSAKSIPYRSLGELVDRGMLTDRFAPFLQAWVRADLARVLDARRVGPPPLETEVRAHDPCRVVAAAAAARDPRGRRPRRRGTGHRWGCDRCCTRGVGAPRRSAHESTFPGGLSRPVWCGNGARCRGGCRRTRTASRHSPAVEWHADHPSRAASVVNLRPARSKSRSREVAKPGQQFGQVAPSLSCGRSA